MLADERAVDREEHTDVVCGSSQAPDHARDRRPNLEAVFLDRNGRPRLSPLPSASRSSHQASASQARSASVRPSSRAIALGEPKRTLAPPRSRMPVMDGWLTTARDRLSEASGLRADELELTSELEATLLDVARIAAHESGARTNAPLLCYLLGRAAGRSGADLDALAAAVTHGTAPPSPG